MACAAGEDGAEPTEAAGVTAFDGFCEPGEATCTAAGSSLVCGPDRRWSETACGDGAACEAGSGRCADVLCSPGEAFCTSLGSFRTCAPDGLSLAGPEVACGPGEVCSDGRCRACLPGAFACVSSSELGRCAPDGSGFEVEASCPSGTSCHGPSASCASTACPGGPASCASPTTYQLCQGSEGYGGTTHPCGLGEVCLDGACLGCADGYSRCAGPGVLEVCDAKTGGYVEEPCPPLAPCSGVPSECRPAVPPFCLAGLPECLDEESYATCDGEGHATTGEVRVCPFGEACSFGACVPAAGRGRLLVLLDRSAAMSGAWDDVPAALWSVLSTRPGLRYGLALYPGKDGLHAPAWPQLAMGKLNATTVLVSVLHAFGPSGPAPLAEALDRVIASPEAFLEGEGAHVVVVTAGVHDCGAEPCPEALETRVGALHEVLGATVHAIGLGGEGALADAIASAGGGLSEVVHDGGDLALDLAAALDAVALAASPAPPP
jgi:hypothetical protein